MEPHAPRIWMLHTCSALQRWGCWAGSTLRNLHWDGLMYGVLFYKFNVWQRYSKNQWIPWNPGNLLHLWNLWKLWNLWTHGSMEPMIECNSWSPSNSWNPWIYGAHDRVQFMKPIEFIGPMDLMEPEAHMEPKEVMQFIKPHGINWAHAANKLAKAVAPDQRFLEPVKFCIEMNIAMLYIMFHDNPRGRSQRGVIH